MGLGVPLEPLPLPLTVSEASGNISGPCLATRPGAGVIWAGWGSMAADHADITVISFFILYVDMSGTHAYIDSIAMVFQTCVIVFK